MLQLPFSMLMALTLVRGNLRFSSIFRAIFFVPYVFSEIITGLIWVSGGLLIAVPLLEPKSSKYTESPSHSSRA